MTHTQWISESRAWRSSRWIAPPVCCHYQEVWMSAQLVLASNSVMITENPSLFPSGVLDGVGDYRNAPKVLMGVYAQGWIGLWKEFKE